MWPMTPEQLLLARALRGLTYDDGDWDGSAWNPDPAWEERWEASAPALEDDTQVAPFTVKVMFGDGSPLREEPHHQAWIRVTDIAFDYPSLVSNAGRLGPDGKYEDPDWTHVPILGHDGTLGCVMGMLWRTLGFEHAWVTPVFTKDGAFGGWSVCRLTRPKAAETITGWKSFSTPVEAVGHALLVARGVPIDSTNN